MERTEDNEVNSIFGCALFSESYDPVVLYPRHPAGLETSGDPFREDPPFGGSRETISPTRFAEILISRQSSQSNRTRAKGEDPANF